jgi:ATPase family protein associated with various cellular activities (AAA)/winged helix domain-containing protein
MTAVASYPTTPPPTRASWRHDNAAWLRLALRRLRLLLERHALSLRGGPGQPRAAGWLLAGDPPRSPAPEPVLEKALTAATQELRTLEQNMRDAGRPPALRVLAELAEFSSFESDLLLLAAAPALDGAFALAYAELHDDARRDHATLHLALALFVDEGSARVLSADWLMPTRRLRGLALVQVGGADDDPILARPLSVDERLADYLRGINHCDQRLAPFLSTVPAGPSCAGLVAAARDIAALVADAPDARACINLVGAAADGACDVARLACGDLGFDLGAVDVARLAALPVPERARLIALMAREAVLAGLALFADADADCAEPGDAATATAIDDLVQLFPGALFLASRERWPGTHDGTVVVPVARPGRDEQAELWRAALSAHPHALGDGFVGAVVEQFDLGPAATRATVARAALAGRGHITEAALWAACRGQTGAALDQLAHRIVPCHTWDDLVVGEDVRAQLRELASQVEQRGRVYETWGFGPRLGRGRGIAALFSGPSGTGKTMAAEILAAHLRLDLQRIDLASVVSKYIGETEKNLRRVFDAAERSGAILFFDEADALFGTRTQVRDSHDRYANLEINYLLQRMEDYVGLAILATNRGAALDSAFLRRLRFAIEFPFPGEADRRRIWERVFPPQAALDGVDHGRLARLELAGGNIRTIALNAAFLAAAEGRPIGMPHLARAIAREYAKLSKPLGPAQLAVYAQGVPP